MPSKAKPKPAVNGTPEVSDILTLAEAAAYLKVSEAGLKADLERGAVPARFVAGEWRFSKAAILVWLSAITSSTKHWPIPELSQVSDEEVEAEIAKLRADRDKNAKSSRKRVAS
jgi:hypothetical protein